MEMYSQTSQHLDEAFFALSDPTRRAILLRLSEGPATVSELTDPFDLTQPTISKHLRVLEQAGLIETAREAQKRPRKLAPLAIKGLADWLELFRRQWEGRLNNLEAHLEKMSQQEK
jgi:DNA-binding transcriptional ArsR family regulator